MYHEMGQFSMQGKKKQMVDIQTKNSSHNTHKKLNKKSNMMCNIDKEKGKWYIKVNERRQSEVPSANEK